MQQLSEKSSKQKSENDLRLLPLGIAALICFIVAVSSGTLVWYFFGSKSPLRNHQLVVAVPRTTVSPEIIEKTEVAASTDVSPVPPPTTETSPLQTSAQPSPAPVESTEASRIVQPPAGELPVEGGEVVLGGGETKLPLRRVSIGSFAIAETEVTNKQFREFIDETKAKIKLSSENDDEPVTNISWSEAKAYCQWLSQKIGAEVRLPTEAEWELAARGKDGWKYPWGNQWQDDKAACKENNGQVRPVKSYPNGKSPFGAYDMVGNVWEWTLDAGRDESGKIVKYKGNNSAFANETVYIIKGGAAIEAKANNNAQARISMPSNFKSPDIGFRYVVIREKLVQSGSNN